MPFMTPASVKNLSEYLFDDRENKRMRTAKKEKEQAAQEKKQIANVAFQIHKITNSGLDQETKVKQIGAIEEQYKDNLDVLQLAMGSVKALKNSGIAAEDRQFKLSKRQAGEDALQEAKNYETFKYDRLTGSPTAAPSTKAQYLLGQEQDEKSKADKTWELNNSKTKQLLENAKGAATLLSDSKKKTKLKDEIDAATNKYYEISKGGDPTEWLSRQPDNIKYGVQNNVSANNKKKQDDAVEYSTKLAKLTTAQNKAKGKSGEEFAPSPQQKANEYYLGLLDQGYKESDFIVKTAKRAANKGGPNKLERYKFVEERMKDAETNMEISRKDTEAYNQMKIDIGEVYDSLFDTETEKKKPKKPSWRDY